jgi:gliding motility-associated-like protein
MRSLLVILGCLLVVLSIDASGQMMDDFATTDEEESVRLDVIANDDVYLPQPNTVDLNTSLPGRQTKISTSEGNYAVDNDGHVTFFPVDDFFGSSSLQYSINYGFFGFQVGTATIYVTVNGVNDRPVTENDEAETDEDVPININVLANDSDADNDIDPGSIVITNTQGGTFVANASGQVTFTPTPEFSGNASAEYTVKDFAGATSNRSDIVIRVHGVNDPPVVDDDAATTDEGIPVKIKILANDYDVDGNIEPSSVLITGENGGSFVANNNGEVTFTPSPGFYGIATANYTVQDDDGLGSKSATITVTVNSVNVPPIATNDIVNTSEDVSPLAINVIANDSDPDGSLNPASVIVTNAVNGTFVPNQSGFVTYTPPLNFNGIATAKYTVKDNEGRVSNEATITVTVNAVNDPPSFDPIANQRVLKNSANKTINITGITAGPLETETLTLKATSDAPGIVPNPVISYNGTASTATLTFKPQANQAGNATITVDLTDQGPNKFTRKFDIDVIDVEFTSVPITIATPGQLYQYDIKITDVTETLTIIATQKPAWATLTSTGKNKAKLSGTPPANAPLTSPVTLQLKDGSTILDQQQFTIIVNRPPTVAAFGVNTQEDVAAVFKVEDFKKAFTDPDNQSVAEVMITKLPAHGTLKLGTVALASGAKIPSASIPNLTYNPNTEYNGSDVASWKGSDGYSYSQNEADISFVIAPANDAPVIDIVETEHLQYELGSELPIKLTSTLTIRDADDITLAGAEIGIRYLTYEPGKELLVFKDTLNITGDFNPAAGIMVLSGNSSLANYEAALRKVKYNYVNLNQVNLRTVEIYFSVTDGVNTSNTKSRLVDLIYTFKDLDIPSAFSPNGDRANEAWLITSPNTPDGTVPYTKALIRVYNKRGLVVYEAKGFEKPWDGTYGGKELPVDTYYYTIDLQYNRVRYKGVVTILR